MFNTREEWLLAAVVKMRPWFTEEIGKPVPDSVQVSVGWAKRAGKGAVGWCYHKSVTGDKANAIFISPELHEPVGVLAVLLHELIHAADNGESQHAGWFRKTHRSLGFVDKPTHAVPGDSLTLTLGMIAEGLDDYPHDKIDIASRSIKKQTCRQLKAACPACGYIIRLSRLMMERGLPVCPCGSDFEEA